jgi:hypothetical protein
MKKAPPRRSLFHGAWGDDQTIMPAPTVLLVDSSMTMKAPVPRLSL